MLVMDECCGLLKLVVIILKFIFVVDFLFIMKLVNILLVFGLIIKLYILIWFSEYIIWELFLMLVFKVFICKIFLLNWLFFWIDCL